MDTTQEYLSIPPWFAIINMINRLYSVSLNPTTTKLVGFTPLAGKEVQITVQARRSSNPDNLLGEFETGTYRYDRLDLSEFFPNGVSIEGGVMPSSTIDIIDRLQNQTGYVFDVNDFICRAIENQDYVLEAGPLSLRWVGSVEVTIEATQYSLSGMISTRQFPDTLTYPGSPAAKIQGPLRTMNIDFSHYRDILESLPIGAPGMNPKWLTHLVRDLTGDPWVLSSNSVDWNLGYWTINGEATFNVLYNGPSRLPWSPRADDPTGSRVVVVGLSENLCTNVTGHLLLHYD